MVMVMRAAAVALIGSIVLTGCGPSATGACTEIGCSPGLRVSIASNPLSPWRIEVTDLDSGVMKSVECPATFPATRCPPAFFPDFYATRVRVVTIAGGFVREDRFEATYIDMRPNGPNCPPVCRTAELVVPL